MENILFVCSANIDRSPTAESMYGEDSRFAVQSCGIKPYARNQISQELVDWADKIFVMNEKQDNHKTEILERFAVKEEKIVDLDIPDVYSRGDFRLKREIREKVEQYFCF